MLFFVKKLTAVRRQLDCGLSQHEPQSAQSCTAVHFQKKVTSFFRPIYMHEISTSTVFLFGNISKKLELSFCIPLTYPYL